MKFLLDTDTASFFIRSNPKLRDRVLSEYGNWAISAITYTELARYQFQTPSLMIKEAISAFLIDAKTVEFTSADALEAGRLSVLLRRKGTPIGEYDTLIAGHALSLGATLVTNNTKHFKQVPELRLDNWLNG
ncbi:MAG: hypothetical protein RL174_332 [Actinomycetota bacterium]|jgi:tRNA(fMet)-specific endonuclease VapC